MTLTPQITADDILPVAGLTAPPPVAPPPEARSGNFLRHIHLLRGLAILLVIGAHCWPAFAWSDAEHARILLVFDNVTVVFMFISGLLFQHLSGRFRYPRYLKHRFSIVVLPYMIVSIPAIILVIFFIHRTSVWPWVYEMPVWKQALFFLVTGKQLAPLWFIPMMALFILSSPLLIQIDRRNLYPWVLPASVALAIWLGRDSVEGMLNVFGKAVFMLPAYVSGMAFSRYRVIAEQWCERHIGLLLFGLVAFSLLMLSNPAHADVSLVQKLILALLLIVAVKRLPMPRWVEGALGHVARLSFALYFIHGYVLTCFRISFPYIGRPLPNSSQTGEIFPPSLIGLLLDIALVTLITVAIVEAGRRLLGRYSRYVIGA